MPHWIVEMLPTATQRYSVEIDGRKMHVMEIGAPEGQPVLMLHGNPTWGFLYRDIAAQLLDDNVRIVLPDLFGLGFSDRIKPAEHTLANHGGWIAALLDTLELQRVVFVGQDWGGAIGVLGVGQERLAGLVVLNTVLGPPREGFRPTAFHRLAQTPIISHLLFRGFGFPQVALWTAQGDRASIRGKVAHAYRYPLRGLSNNAAPLALARMVPNSMKHPSVEPLRRCADIISAFEGPSAIVWGDKDPVLGKLIRRTQRALPDAPCVRTEAGHFLQEEVPIPIADAVRDVISRLNQPA